MRITIVLGAFFPVPPVMGGAVEKVWFALGKEFARRGDKVTEISRAFQEFPSRENVDGVEHRRVRGFNQPRSRLWLKILDLVYSLRVLKALPAADILVTNTFWLPLLARSKRSGLLYVHVQRGPKGQMKWYAHAARLLAVSRAIGEAIIAEAPQVADKVRVIPNALPFSIPGRSSGSRGKTLLFVGRIHPEKGIDLFLRAVGKVPAEIAEGWRLEIVGPIETHLGGGGEAFAAGLRDMAARTSIPVEWTGAVFDEAELLRRYQSAAIFVYPSVAETGEALPVAPLEAMANGCAPLVSRLACFKDYIEDGVTGFVFDLRGPNAEKNLGNRLSTILQMHLEDVARIGLAARDRVQEFGVAPVADRYLADFAALLAEHRNQEAT